MEGGSRLVLGRGGELRPVGGGRLELVDVHIWSHQLQICLHSVGVTPFA